MTSDLDDETEVKKVERWDVFKDEPVKKKVGSLNEPKWMEVFVQICKLLIYLLVFAVVLGSAVVSKGTLLFMTSQIAPNRTISYCNKNLGIHKEFVVSLPRTERLAWIWVILISYFVVELATFLRSLRICLFKTWSMPTKFEVLFSFITESLPAIGTSLLVFGVLPELDVLKGVMLTNALCLVPAVAGLFTRNSDYQEMLNDEENSDNEEEGLTKVFNEPKVNQYISKCLDVLSILAQASALVIWPVMENKMSLWIIPAAVILISFGWLENYIPKQVVDKAFKLMTKNHDEDEVDVKDEMKRKHREFRRKFDNSRYFTYLFLSIWKCILFFVTALIVVWVKEGSVDFIFQDFVKAFEEHDIIISEIKPVIDNQTSFDIDAVIDIGKSVNIPSEYFVPIWVLIINIVSTYICYAFGKFACKIMIQTFSYAFPINLVVPVTATLLISMCGMYSEDSCTFHKTIPPYLFFNSPPVYYLWDFIGTQQSWIWFLWLLSQTWITIHLWSPRCEKLAATEKLYVKPMYDAFFIDQSIGMNRRRNDYTSSNKFTIDSNETTKIYACATMWHEEEFEMLEFLKSIIRLDTDQFVRKYVTTELNFTIDDYYELETHVFFDDAFTPTGELNKYVEMLIKAVPKAVREVHTTLRLKKLVPQRYITPYGGRLKWILPGQTEMIVHLKHKKKIRVKKRWSQVMYMYYLLGYRLMANRRLSPMQKEEQSNNTFILALDGDIDFQPKAVHHLVTLMKRNQKVGAACGRIHPLGSGPMVWYQIFEYSVGHWLQKATEHMIGSVLCSPGCFSLFRGSALMDDNIMARYTARAEQASHFLQYDQGEDRWLCTLLLQRGHKVEFCAASDAYTHCPEKFNEFYNQRRRWMPSTFANILDLLIDYDHTIKMNDSISRLYIFYQGFLMVGSVLGPGTIFLMLVGSFVAAFQLSQWSSFIWNGFPIILFMVICYWCKEDIQLFVAGILSLIYGLVMMAVLVGIMLQITEDGPLAPSSLFFFVTVAQMCITAVLHPKEVGNLLYGVVYYVTIPSMYLLLVIYSVFNLNVTSWGTRVDTSADKAEKVNQPTQEGILSNIFGSNEMEKKSGSLEFSFAGLCSCMLCTHRKQSEENVQLLKIISSIDKVSNRLDKIENIIQNDTNSVSDITHFHDDVENNVLQLSQTIPTNNAQRRTSVPKVSKVDNEEFDDLSDSEELTFWEKIINDDSKLKPYEEDPKAAKSLIDLRDRSVMAFIMLNSIFVLVVFLLTLKKDLMHLKWPLNVKVNFTYVDAAREIKIYKEHLQLEPIGLVFLMFFGLLLIIQFVAMLFHRFGTFAQILASTHINWSRFTKMNRKTLTADQYLAIDPVKCVQELVQFKKPKTKTVERRKTVRDRALECGTTHSEFKDLMQAIQENRENDSMRMSIRAAVNRRRSTLISVPIASRA